MKKSVLYILTALLSLLCVQTSMAQAVQDALYIFRNDGQFDAFFYGDIDHIEYSKIDTLGVEQEDYVVQEIYALDTLYRIPISAIDSVAFVTPETKYKADVFLPDKSIADYIVASDSINWIRLATNTPSELIPKKGDKIFIKDASQHIPNGFVGLVTDVSNGSDGYTVMTGELEITDIFERLVAKAAAATDGRNATRGLVDGTEMSYTTEEPLDIIDESETLPLQGSYTIGKFGPIQLSGDVSGSIGYKFKEKMAIRAFLYVDAPTQKMQFTQKTIIYDDLEVEAQIAGSLTSSVDIPVKGFSKKISDFFGLKADVGVTIGAQFTAMEFGYKRQFSGEETSNIIYSNMNESSGLEPSLKKHFELTRDTTECNVSVDGKLTFNVGAFAELNLGVAYPFKKKVPSPEEKSVGVEVKLRGEIGGKMEYDSPLLGLSSTTALDPMTTIDMYGMLNSLGRVSVAGYGKIALSGEIGRWKGSTEPGFDFLKTQVRSIVPNFTGISAKQDPEKPLRPYRIRMNSTADRDLILARYIGFAVYDENDVLVADSLCDFYFKEEWYKKDNNEGTSGCVFELDPGKDEEKTYYVYPMVEYRQHHLLDKDHKHGFTLDAARIEIAERTVYVGDEQGYEEIEVVPNMANMVVKTEGGWLEEPSWLAHLNQLTIYWPELPSGTKERRGVVRLYGLTKDGKDTLTVDSIVVIQSIPYIELTPDRLDFEAKGGTQTVTIGNTNITDIQISTTEFTEDYLSATLDGKVITVTMGENTDSEERGARVWLEGKTQNGDAYKTYVTISQKAGKEKPTEDREDFVIQDSDGESYDRHHQIGWLGNKGTYFEILESADNLKDLSVTCNQDYIHIIEINSQKDRTIVHYSCDRNNSSSERNAYFTVSATKADGTQGVSIFYVTQDYSGVSVENIKKVEFKASLPSSILTDYIKNTDSGVEETKEEPLSKIWGRGLGTYYSGFGASFTTEDSGNGWDVKISASGDNETPIHVVCTRISEGEGVAYSEKVKATETLSFDLPSGFFEGKVTSLEYTVESVTKQDDYVEECSVKFTASDLPSDGEINSYWGINKLQWTGKKSEGVVFTKVEGKYHYWHSWSRYSNTYEKTEDRTWTYIPSEDDRLTLDIKF